MLGVMRAPRKPQPTVNDSGFCRSSTPQACGAERPSNCLATWPLAVGGGMGGAVGRQIPKSFTMSRRPSSEIAINASITTQRRKPAWRTSLEALECELDSFPPLARAPGHYCRDLPWVTRATEFPSKSSTSSVMPNYRSGSRLCCTSRPTARYE